MLIQSVAVLGSTGTIGTRALDVLRKVPDQFRVDVLAAGFNAKLMAEQIIEFRPRLVSVADEATRRQLTEVLADADMPEIVVGDEGLILAAELNTDIVLNAILGAQAILPALTAVRRGVRLALANKECLVAAGDFIMQQASEHGAEIIPVDSEHCALFQAMLAGREHEIHKWVVTASGGPFRTYSKEQLSTVTIADALNHPNWSMGQKITVDSATMMNKGLEVIEAHHLFAAPYDKIEVLVHPQSIVHSMIEFVDGSVMAQLATHDMRLPIQYALLYPERADLDFPRLDFKALHQLTFEEPDFVKFPALALAMEAGRMGGYAPCVLNAANEVAVAAFLQGQIPFVRIIEVVEDTLGESVNESSPTSVDDVLAMDRQARERARAILMKGG